MRRPIMISYLNQGVASTPKITLPQYLLNHTGVEIEPFESTSNWSVGTGSFALNTSEFRTGSASLKFTSTSVKAEKIRTVSIPASTFISVDHIRVYVYLHSNLADYLTIKLWFATDASFTKDIAMSREITPVSHKNGWNCIDFYRSQYTTDGTQLANTDTITRIKVQLNSRTANVVEASFDQILSYVEGVPGVIITFDDGRASTYTYGYQYMKPLRAKATAFVISSDFDVSTYMTSAQIQEMNAGGWLMGNHSSDATDLTTLSQAAAQAKLLTCKNALISLGCTRGAYHVAYPNGGSSETVRAAMAAESMLTGRMNWVDTFPQVSDDIWYTYGFNFPAYNTTLAAVKTLVDNAVSDKRVCGLGFHELVTGTPTATQWKASDFQSLVDYIKTLGIPFLGIDDLYAARTGPVTVTL